MADEKIERIQKFQSNDSLKYKPKETVVSSDNLNKIQAGILFLNDAIVGEKYFLSIGGEIFNDYDNNEATGNYSHAEGLENLAKGEASHVEGMNTTATGMDSHAEGFGTKASGHYSHVEGSDTEASGSCSHAEGGESEASGNYSHSEGYKNCALGEASHVEGMNTIANSDISHTEGFYTKASGKYQHVQGKYNIEDTANKYAHIVGNGISDIKRSNAHTLDWNGNAWFAGDIKIGGTKYDDINAVSLNNLVANYVGKRTYDGGEIFNDYENNNANGSHSHAEGSNTFAAGTCSHAEGWGTHSAGQFSHTEGYGTVAGSRYQHIEGIYNIADNIDRYVHIVGNGNDTKRSNAHTLDWNGNAWYAGDIKIGGTSYYDNNAISLNNLATNYVGKKNDNNGEIFNDYENNSAGPSAHAEGHGTIADGEASHAEGTATRSQGNYSHAEGEATEAIAQSSHSEGTHTKASGYSSHAEGLGTIAAGEYQHIQGKYNIEDTANKYAHIVGNGTSDSNRSNTHTLDWNGNAWFARDIRVGGSGYNDPNAIRLITSNSIFYNLPNRKLISKNTNEHTILDGKDIFSYNYIGKIPDQEIIDNISQYYFITFLKKELRYANSGTFRLEYRPVSLSVTMDHRPSNYTIIRKDYNDDDSYASDTPSFKYGIRINDDGKIYASLYGENDYTIDNLEIIAIKGKCIEIPMPEDNN